MNDVTAAYIAGLMDGEGCFYLERFATKKSPIGFQYRSIATITMCDKKTIDVVCSATGKNFRERKLKSGRTAFTIDWRNGIASKFIQTILPYLVGKREQAELCLHFEADIAPGRGRTYKPEDAERCEAVRQRLKDLKR